MKIIVLIVLSIALLQGCCKEACIDAQLDLSFQNFKAKDTDSVQLISYQKGTGQAIDSSWQRASISVNDTLPSPLFITIYPHRDYEVRIKNLNKTYRISNFEVQQARCHCGGGRTTRLVSYKVNGTTREGYLLVLQ